MRKGQSMNALACSCRRSLLAVWELLSTSRNLHVLCDLCIEAVAEGVVARRPARDLEARAVVVVLSGCARFYASHDTAGTRDGSGRYDGQGFVRTAAGAVDRSLEKALRDTERAERRCGC